MKITTTLLAMALALPAMAATPPATTKPAAKPAPLPLAPGERRPILSPEGIAIAQKIMASDPRMNQIQAEMASIRQDKAKAANARPVDIDRLASLLQRETALIGEGLTRRNDRMIALLRALPEADRAIMMQQLANPPQLQNSRPAASAMPAAPAAGH